MDEFDRVAHLEDHFFRQGVDAGLKVGRMEGFVEGEKMGYGKGYSLAAEVGFYLGVLDLLSSLSGSSEAQKSSVNASISTSSGENLVQEDVLGLKKVRKTLEAIRVNAEQFDDEQTLRLEVLEDLHTIRSKFKLLSSQLGLKMRFTGTTVDKTSEDQVPAGMPSVDF